MIDAGIPPHSTVTLFGQLGPGSGCLNHHRVEARTSVRHWRSLRRACPAACGRCRCNPSSSRCTRCQHQHRSGWLRPISGLLATRWSPLGAAPIRWQHYSLDDHWQPTPNCQGLFFAWIARPMPMPRRCLPTTGVTRAGTRKRESERGKEEGEGRRLKLKPRALANERNQKMGVGGGMDGWAPRNPHTALPPRIINHTHC